MGGVDAETAETNDMFLPTRDETNPEAIGGRDVKEGSKGRSKLGVNVKKYPAFTKHLRYHPPLPRTPAVRRVINSIVWQLESFVHVF